MQKKEGAIIEIINVLSEKLKVIQSSENCLDISFTKDEVLVINDLNQLRFLKLSHTFPDNFQMHRDKFLCFTQIKQLSKSSENSNIILYLVLEFFAHCNPFLRTNVSKVFKRNGINFSTDF